MEESNSKTCKGHGNHENGPLSLHQAAIEGRIDEIRKILSSGTDPDALDEKGCTALHLALRCHQITSALNLLHFGCDIDVADNNGDGPIHMAARDGLLTVARSLCAFGCKVDVQNKDGEYPLHLAVKNGHLEIVRCLCLADCDVEVKNQNGIEAEVMALARNQNETALLLDRIRNAEIRERLIAEMIPDSESVAKIKVKLFGNSGSGKSTFVESLQTGYFSSWFKRSFSSKNASTKTRKGAHGRKPPIKITNTPIHEPQSNYPTSYDTYTRGINISQLNIAGVGDVSIWEFSGHQPYQQMYDHFLGNTNCLHLVFFKLSDTLEVQKQQVHFWLKYLQSRIIIQEPLGFGGKSSKAGHVALVATFADSSSALRVASTGEYLSSEASSILKNVHKTFDSVFEIHDTVFVMDARENGSVGLKSIKNFLWECRTELTQDLPKTTGFLENVYSHLNEWRQSVPDSTIVTWEEFVDIIRSEVNILAGEEHVKEILQQLQVMGEILYVECEPVDLVILDPRWLCGTVVGHLLSQENIDCSRVTGIYSADDIHLMFPETDEAKLFMILEALEFCTECETDDEIEFEFPCFNLMEAQSDVWEPDESRFDSYGGVRFVTKEKQLFANLFPRLQVRLRRWCRDTQMPNVDLYQWHNGSRLSNGVIEALVQLNVEGFEVKVRGPSSMPVECTFFQDDLVNIIEQAFRDICPGILTEKYILSSLQLKCHSKDVHAYSPSSIVNVLLEDGINGTVSDTSMGLEETLVSLIFFGSFQPLKNKKDSQLLIRSKKLCKSLSNPSTMPLDKVSSMNPSSFLHGFNKNSARRQSLPQSCTISTLDNNLKQPVSFSTKCICQYDAKYSSKNIENEEEKPLISLLPDIHASCLAIPCKQLLCNILDPQDSMGKDWCMLGVLLNMADRLPKLDPANNLVFSPTSCLLNEWMMKPESRLKLLLSHLKVLDRPDAIDILRPFLPLYKINF